MILSRWQLVLTPTPHLHLSPSSGRGERRGDKAKVTIAEATSRPAVAPYEYDFVRVSAYCTVTSVPTGISEKNLRAVSSGNRMQPCDAG
jgi:hypothetical protein